MSTSARCCQPAVAKWARNAGFAVKEGNQQHAAWKSESPARKIRSSFILLGMDERGRSSSGVGPIVPRPNFAIQGSFSSESLIVVSFKAARGQVPLLVITESHVVGRHGSDKDFGPQPSDFIQ